MVLNNTTPVWESGSIQLKCQQTLCHGVWWVTSDPVPRKEFYRIGISSSEFEEIHSLVLFRSVLNSTISCTSQLGEVCPLLWCLGLHDHAVMLHRLYSTHPFLSCSIGFRTVVPYKKWAEHLRPYSLEDPSYDTRSLIWCTRSMPDRISLNHLLYLSKTTCSVVNMHARLSALPKQPLVVQVTNPRAVQYEDHPQGNYALLESSDWHPSEYPHNPTLPCGRVWWPESWFQPLPMEEHQ